MARALSKDDATLVLSSYLARPVGMSLPPLLERQRMAALLRRDLQDINDAMNEFVAIEAGDGGGAQAARLWDKYGHEPIECAIAADEIMQNRRRVPYHLRKRMD